jgi:membrane dipeptidase
MGAFIPPFVSAAARGWAEGLDPQLPAAGSDEVWRRITAAYEGEPGAAPRATVGDVADHIEHIARVAGIDHVGIGADFYGAEGDSEVVEGLEDVSRYPDLFAELVRRGWSDEHLAKLAGRNLLRVLAEVETVAARLAAERRPSLATFEEPETAAGD